MAAKTNQKTGPNFPPEGSPSLSEAQKDELFVHMIRRPGVFDEAIGRMPKSLLKGEDDKYRVLLWACHKVAECSTLKPGDKKFKRLLRDQVRVIGKAQAHDEVLSEAAEAIAKEDGFLDEAYAVDQGELSDELARSLLKRYLSELLVIGPLRQLLADCGEDVPKNLPAVLDQLLSRTRQLDGIDAKPVRSLGEEWDEHTTRLNQFRGRTMIGLKTGLPELDRRTLGLRGLFVFGAKPGAGKTTYGAVEVALGVCRHHQDNDCAVVVVCLDMDRFELYRRVNCNLGDIEWVPLMFGSPEKSREPGSMFSMAHHRCLTKARQRLEDEQIGLRLAIPDRTVLGEDVTAQRLSAVIQEHKAHAGAKRALVVIDYLQLIPVPDEVSERGDLAADKYRVRVIQQVIERSRTLDDPLGDTALVISETRKPAKRNEEWGDSMSELMGSARLGYAGDAVLLYRAMTAKEMGVYYGTRDKAAAEKRREHLHEQGVSPVTLILEKGRDGMIRGSWGAEFHFKKSRFRELTPGQRMLASMPPPPDAAAGGETTDEGNGPPAPPASACASLVPSAPPSSPAASTGSTATT